MVIVLSGESTDDITVPAEQVKKAGVNKIIVVGIGHVLSEDLKATASTPQNVVMSPRFTQLPQKVPDVIALINAGNYNPDKKNMYSERYKSLLFLCVV